MPRATTPRAAHSSPAEGRLRRNGTRRVLMAKMIRVWVAMDSINQPARNSPGAALKTNSISAKGGEVKQ